MNRRSVAEHNALASVLDTMPPTRLTAGFPPLPDEAVLVDEQPTPPAAPAWPVPLLGGVAPPELQADALPGWLGEFVGALCASTQTPATMAVGVTL